MNYAEIVRYEIDLKMWSRFRLDGWKRKIFGRRGNNRNKCELVINIGFSLMES